LHQAGINNGKQSNLAAQPEFNRRESPTQTPADAIAQAISMEIWGQPAQGSNLPSVKAYRESHLPLARHGPRGVLFATDIAPTLGTGTPFEARWYGGSAGVLDKPNGFVAIPIISFVNLQP